MLGGYGWTKWFLALPVFCTLAWLAFMLNNAPAVVENSAFTEALISAENAEKASSESLDRNGSSDFTDSQGASKKNQWTWKRAAYPCVIDLQWPYPAGFNDALGKIKWMVVLARVYDCLLLVPSPSIMLDTGAHNGKVPLKGIAWEKYLVVPVRMFVSPDTVERLDNNQYVRIPGNDSARPGIWKKITHRHVLENKLPPMSLMRKISKAEKDWRNLVVDLVELRFTQNQFWESPSLKAQMDLYRTDPAFAFQFDNFTWLHSNFIRDTAQQISSTFQNISITGITLRRGDRSKQYAEGCANVPGVLCSLVSILKLKRCQRTTGVFVGTNEKDEDYLRRLRRGLARHFETVYLERDFPSLQLNDTFASVLIINLIMRSSMCTIRFHPIFDNKVDGCPVEFKGQNLTCQNIAGPYVDNKGSHLTVEQTRCKLQFIFPNGTAIAGNLSGDNLTVADWTSGMTLKNGKIQFPGGKSWIASADKPVVIKQPPGPPSPEFSSKCRETARASQRLNPSAR